MAISSNSHFFSDSVKPISDALMGEHDLIREIKILGLNGHFNDQINESIRTTTSPIDCFSNAKKNMMRLSNTEIRELLINRSGLKNYKEDEANGEKYLEFLSLMVVLTERFNDEQLFEIYTEAMKTFPKDTSFYSKQVLLIHQIQHIKVKKNSEIQDRLQSRPFELREKDGVIWKCLERKAVNGGYIYRFAYFPENETDDPFPAVEPDKSFSFDNLTITTQEKLRALGYHRESQLGIEYLELPDYNVLLERADALRLKDKLSLIDAPGIADDLEFAELIAKGSIILSRGAEFIHDHYAHVLVRLENIFNEKDEDIKIIQEKTAQMVEICKLANEILDSSPNGIYDYTDTSTDSQLSANSLEESAQINRMMLDRLQATTGAIADAFSSVSFEQQQELDLSILPTLHSDHMLSMIWTTNDWNNYLNERFKTDAIGQWEAENPRELGLFCQRTLQVRMEALV
ncbi:MAG: hypothetical protein K2P51_04400 [Rhabdochlamydiaceae bacterium]|nr:hypothetical protein [Rhabdochlamydiaceae bacterium]